MASIFTKIINRELPAQILYEDERFIAILDINPVNYGHALVITKEEFPDFDSLEPTILGPLFATTQQVAKAVVRGVSAQGYNIFINNGAASGQEIAHFHAHIVPRFENDGYKHWQGSPYNDTEHMKDVADSIRKAI